MNSPKHPTSAPRSNRPTPATRVAEPLDARGTHEKANDGVYRTQLPYARATHDRPVYEAYEADINRLHQLFRSDLEHEFGMVGHPKADALFRLAWEHGHASGHAEVASYYSEFAELAK